MNWYHTYKKDFRANIVLAFPIIIGQLGQVMVNIADNMMVGRLGAIELAAVSLGVAVFAVFFVIGMGLSLALPPLVAEADGKGDHQSISSNFKHSLITNLVFALISVIVIEFGMPVLYYLGQEEQVVTLAIPYIRLSAYSMIPFMLFQSLRCLSDGVSETWPPMIAMLIGNGLNILLNYMLIFGKFGAPAMGVEGAALSSLISRIVMLFLLIALFRYWKDLWSYVERVDLRKYSKVAFQKILSLGVPTALQLLFEIIIFSGSAILIGRISAEAQAAHQIALNLITISFMVCVGLSVASTIRVGNQLGKGDVPAMRRVGFSVIIQAVAFMALSGLFFIFMRFFLPSLYIQNQEVIEIAAGLLFFAAIFQIPDGVQAVSIGALRGMQDIKAPAAITFVAYILIGLPAAYIFSFILGWGAEGVWVGLLVGLFSSAIMNTWRFERKTRVLLDA